MRRARLEREERLREARVYDTVQGQAVYPHNFAEEGGFANKIYRNTFFDTSGNLIETVKSK